MGRIVLHSWRVTSCCQVAVRIIPSRVRDPYCFIRNEWRWNVHSFLYWFNAGDNGFFFAAFANVFGVVSRNQEVECEEPIFPGPFRQVARWIGLRAMYYGFFFRLLGLLCKRRLTVSACQFAKLWLLTRVFYGAKDFQ